MDWPGKFEFAGAKFVYNRLYSGLETIYSTGTTNETLEIQLLAVGSNPGIQYEYVVPVDPTRVTYSWQADATTCSEKCGGGFEEVTARCVSNKGEAAADDKCVAADKPVVGRFRCNVEACPPRWVPQQWTRCSRSCGTGKQRRDIYCMQRYGVGDERRVKNKYCTGKRPPKARRCNLQDCKPEWTVGKWSQCSTTCGKGMQRRAVYCTSTSRKSSVLSDASCDPKTKPSNYQNCMNRQCAVDWYIKPWSQCSVSCGRGTQSRQVVCVSREPGSGSDSVVDSQLCEHLRRPNVLLLQNCQLRDTCPKWQSGSWSQCSSTCGESERRRTVTCQASSGEIINGCDQRDKPSELQRCHLPSCPTISTSVPHTTKDIVTTTTTVAPTTTSRSCVDTKSWCPSLRKYRYYCMRSYYRSVCCSTCSQG